ncbi:hypothetical protein V3C99_015746 [Haemonchus contortus]
MQHHVLVDCGFAQGHRFVRSYERARSDAPGKRRFNAKHSGVRRVVESTFGMLSRRFGHSRAVYRWSHPTLLTLWCHCWCYTI